MTAATAFSAAREPKMEASLNREEPPPAKVRERPECDEGYVELVTDQSDGRSFHVDRSCVELGVQEFSVSTVVDEHIGCHPSFHFHQNWWSWQASGRVYTPLKLHLLHM